MTHANNPGRDSPPPTKANPTRKKKNPPPQPSPFLLLPSFRFTILENISFSFTSEKPQHNSFNFCSFRVTSQANKRSPTERGKKEREIGNLIQLQRFNVNTGRTMTHIRYDQDYHAIYIVRLVLSHIFTFWLLFPFNFFFKLELDMEIPHGGQQQGRRVAFKKSPHGSSDPHIHTHIHTTMAESSTRYTTSKADEFNFPLLVER